jgi:opacity protein-like surface antigen
MHYGLRYYLGVAAILTAFCTSVSADTRSQDQTDVLETHRVAEAQTKPATPPADFDRRRPWYVSLHLGGVIFPEMVFEGNGLEIITPLDPGFGIGGAFGYKFDLGLRLETEFTYRISEATSVRFVGLGSILTASGGVESVNVMLNGWYDVEFLSFLLGNWVPYFGGGAGYAKFWVDPGYWDAGGCGCDPPVAVPVVEASDTALVWQAGGGLAYKYSEAVQIAVDYRFLRPFGRLSFDDPLYPEPLKAKYQSQSIFLVFRGFF